MNSKDLILYLDLCRTSGMNKDRLYGTQEDLWLVMEVVESILKESNNQEIFVRLENLVIETIDLTKDTYFKYGELYKESELG